MNETGGYEPEANGMKTTIVVVDGADGLTPDFLRTRKPWPPPTAASAVTPILYDQDCPPDTVYGINRKYIFNPDAFDDKTVVGFIRMGMKPVAPRHYFVDPMHD